MRWTESETRLFVDCNLGRIASVVQEISIETEHVKTHRTEKERQQMTLLEKFLFECSEKAEIAKEGTLDVGFTTLTRASAIQQQREGVHAAL